MKAFFSHSLPLAILTLYLFSFSLMRGQDTVLISVITDDYPQDLSWALYDAQDSLLAENDGSSWSANMSYLDTLALTSATCLRFVISDAFGDGITPPGGYHVQLNGATVANGGLFTEEEEIYVNCGSGEACVTAVPIVIDTSFALYKSPVTQTWWYSFSPQTDGLFQFNTCVNFQPVAPFWPDTRLRLYDNCGASIHESGPAGAINYSEDFSACAPASGFNFVPLQAGNQYFMRLDLHDLSWSDSLKLRVLRYPPRLGCTDSASCNFDPFATVDDGSCDYSSCAPDLAINDSVFLASLELDQIFNSDNCFVEEGCLNGTGLRDIVRFTSEFANIGTADYIIGYPEINSSSFSNDNCHEHWHQLGYAEYLLYAGAGDPVPLGFKNGFCVEDVSCETGGPTYSCGYMGLSTGCADIYHKSLDCQWIDVTDVPDGSYTIVARINYARLPDLRGMQEATYDNNWAQACITLDRSSGSLVMHVDSTCAAYVDCAGDTFGITTLDCAGVCGGLAHYGDLDNDLIETRMDVEMYLDGIINDLIPAESCYDLNADSLISLYDAALLNECRIEQEGANHGDPFHEDCLFPAGIVNPMDSAWLTISSFDQGQGYLEIAYHAPMSELVGFSFEIEGVEIAEVEMLVDSASFPLELLHNSQQILGLSIEDSALSRNSSFEPLLRIQLGELTGDSICIASVKEMINRDYQLMAAGSLPNCQSVILASNEALAQTFQLFPNPAKETVNIQFGNAVARQIRLMDMRGRMLQEKESKEEQITLKLHGLANGIYLIQIQDNHQSFTQKLMIYN